MFIVYGRLQVLDTKPALFMVVTNDSFSTFIMADSADPSQFTVGFSVILTPERACDQFRGKMANDGDTVSASALDTITELPRVS